MSVGIQPSNRGVSPVVAVILMVAITVILSAAMGAFVFNIGQSSTDSKQQSLGVSMSQTDTGLEVTVVTGEADTLEILVNGEAIRTLSSPTAGDSVVVSVAEGDDVSIVSSTDGNKRVVSQTTVGEASSQTGLIAHYRFEEGSGSTAYDTAGTNDGILNGSSWTSSSLVGSNALEFNGASSVEANSTVLESGSNFTISMWIKPAKTYNSSTDLVYFLAEDGRVSMEHGNTNNGGSNALSIRIFDGTQHYATKDMNLNAGTKYFLTGTFDGSTLSLYVDGVQVNSTSGGWASLDYPLVIGESRSYTRGFNGIIDDVRIYNRELSKSEVSDIYNSTK